jgi:hypothetical protein
MIAIASPATPQLGSLLPRVVRPRRWRSPPKIFHQPLPSLAAAKYHPMAGKERRLATLDPSKSSLMVMAPAPQKTPATLKSP